MTQWVNTNKKSVVSRLAVPRVNNCLRRTSVPEQTEPAETQGSRTSGPCTFHEAVMSVRSPWLTPYPLPPLLPRGGPDEVLSRVLRDTRVIWGTRAQVTYRP